VTTKTQAKSRTRRTLDEIVRALLDKTIENGATAGEERAAVAKAEQLIAKHQLERSEFQFPPDRRLLCRPVEEAHDPRGLRGAARAGAGAGLRGDSVAGAGRVHRLQDHRQVPALLRHRNARAGRAGAEPATGDGDRRSEAPVST
jgi:hypothetical protein